MSKQTGLLPFVVIAALVVALGYATWARQNDRAVFASLRKNYDRVVLEARFPAAGDFVSDTDIRLLSERGDTTSIAAMVGGRPAFVYIERMGCPFCDWFEEEMARRAPGWKDSLLVISLASHPDSIRGHVGVPKEDRQKVPGTPLFLVVNSDGMIVSSALGAKRMLGLMGLHGLSAPSMSEAERLMASEESTSDSP